MLAEEKGSIAAELLKKSTKPQVRGRILASQTTAKTEFQTRTLEQKTATISEAVTQSLIKAVQISHQHGHRYVGTEHMLKSILAMGAPEVDTWLSERSIRPHELEKNLKIVLESTAKFPDLTAVFREESETQTKSPGKPSALDYFGRELTSREVQQTIDPVIGRELEIERVIHILCRRYKNNPLLLGEAGVGKTAIVEGLAKRMLEGTVPAVLANKKIVTLDLGAMVAGTMYRGEFEARLKQTLETAEKEKNVILFIDEMHTIIGAGAASGSLDAANMLKPALARGGISIIGATTLEEYKKHIEGDSALERRLAPIMVHEPNAQETREVLAGIRKNYENYHNVTISDQALDAAVELSNRYMPERLQPDKSIDLLDEASSAVKVQRSSTDTWQKIRAIESDILDIQQKKRDQVSREQYHEAISLKNQEHTLQLAREELLAQTKAYTETRITVTREHILAVVSALAKIPLGHLAQDERIKFSQLEKMLGAIIVGQNQALEKISNLIRRSRTGVNDPNRPLASFMFLGPSGVGKTETARAIAHAVFGDHKAINTLDMSEYSEPYSISKLVGSPAGYVGYRDSNSFTDKVRQNGHSVLLLDEIEKAHPEVFNLLLSILEEGSIKDATGRMVNFRNTIIIMTSNIGLSTFNHAARLGFGSQDGKEAIEIINKATVLGELKERFRPEFLNRIDSTILFNPLTEKTCEMIVARYVSELNERLTREHIRITLSTAAVSHIIQHGYHPDVGARGIRRFFQDHIESEIAKHLLSASDARTEMRNMNIDVSNNTLTFTETA